MATSDSHPDQKRHGEETREAERALEADLSAPDMPAEICRILDLLVEKDRIRLPVLPLVPDRIRKTLSDDQASFEKIAQALGMDPAVSSRILEIANSPYYAAKQKITNVKQAVMRIGLADTCNIAQTALAEGIFKTPNRRLIHLMGQLWFHSLACAYINEIIGQTMGSANKEDLFVLGLLHDIGKLLILHLVDQGCDARLWPDEVINDDLLQELFVSRHNAMGAHLVEKWQYTDPFPQVIREHNNDERIHEQDEVVIVTYVANLMTRRLGYSLVPCDDPVRDQERIADILNISEKAFESLAKVVEGRVTMVRRSLIESWEKQRRPGGADHDRRDGDGGSGAVSG